MAWNPGEAQPQPLLRERAEMGPLVLGLGGMPSLPVDVFSYDKVSNEHFDSVVFPSAMHFSKS